MLTKEKLEELSYGQLIEHVLSLQERLEVYEPSRQALIDRAMKIDPRIVNIARAQNGQYYGYVVKPQIMCGFWGDPFSIFPAIDLSIVRCEDWQDSLFAVNEETT